MSTYGATEMNTPVNLIGADDQVTDRKGVHTPSILLSDQIMGPIPFSVGGDKTITEWNVSLN